MPSQSLASWQQDRCAALDRLEKVHAAVTRGLRGRPRDVTELNHALSLRVAAELQGFCRDLHDEAVEALTGPAQIPHDDLRQVVRTALTKGRKLDHGNAGPASIGTDWSALGIQLWPTLKAEYPGERRAPRWNSCLEWVNLARNGIAHNDPVKIADAHAQHPLTLQTFRKTRRVVSTFAVALDEVTGAFLTDILGTAPWVGKECS